MIRFTAVLLCVALTVVGIGIFSVREGWIAGLPSFFYESIAVLSIFTLVMYRYLDRIADPGMFVQMYLLSMAVKLLAYGAYVVLMFIDDQSGANKNALFFLFLYVIFTAMEVLFLYRKIAGNRPR